LAGYFELDLVAMMDYLNQDNGIYQYCLTFAAFETCEGKV
jgi:hypothetical protein